MQIANNGADYVSAPKDYAELFELYYTFVVRLVRSYGIDESRKEDVASEILLRFLERDFLAKFDPTLTFTYEGTERPAKFRSFLAKFVLAYVKGHRDKQQRLSTREVLICDMRVNDSHNTKSGGIRWVDAYGPTTDGPEEDVLDMVVEEGAVQQMRAYLQEVPRRSRFDNCDLVRLFDEVVAQIRSHGEPNIAALKQTFSVSTTAMHSWMWWLKENLCTATGRTLPPKRPRTTRKRAEP